MENELECGWFNKKKINISENYEVDFWASKLGVAPEKIRNAVLQSGLYSIKEIKLYLGLS